MTKPGLPEDERKAEVKEGLGQDQPERGWARDKQGVGPVTQPGARAAACLGPGALAPLITLSRVTITFSTAGSTPQGRAKRLL